MKKLLSFILILSFLFSTVNFVYADEETVAFDICGTEKYDYAYEALKLTNEERERLGLAPLVMDEGLLDTAMQRAAECAICFSHTRPDGQVCFSAINGAFYSASENIAAGYASPEAAVDSWINSEGHYASMINSSFNSIGIGCFESSSGWLFWVQVFTLNPSPASVTVSGDKNATRTIEAVDSNLSLSVRVSDIPVYAQSSVEVVNSNSDIPYMTQIIDPHSFTYSTDSPDIAVVDENGTVCGISVGTASITATMKDSPDISVSSVINISEPPQITFNESGFATDIPLGSTASDYFMFQVTDEYGNLLLTDDIIKTGCTVYYKNIPYTVIICGDVNIDGKINSTDFMQVRMQFLGNYTMTEIKKLTADVNKDGKINSTDFMQIRKHFLGTYNLFE